VRNRLTVEGSGTTVREKVKSNIKDRTLKVPTAIIEATKRDLIQSIVTDSSLTRYDLWCSEELTAKQNETATMIRMKITKRRGEKDIQIELNFEL
jgi:hypothetical protein